jgi:hypothetical protein
MRVASSRCSGQRLRVSATPEYPCGRGGTRGGRQVYGSQESAFRVETSLMKRSPISVLLGFTLVACAPVTPTGRPMSIESPTITANATFGNMATCPVTLPIGAAPSGQERPFASSALAFGNNQLWVVPIQEDGVIRADSRSIESDGSISTKFGWWRITPGTLSISGRRLDASAPPLRADVPDGYGSSGFQASGVFFPSEGCWEITGAVGNASLSFVTFVRRT